MLDFNLQLAKSDFTLFLYCLANVTDIDNLDWVHRPERADASLSDAKGRLMGRVDVWKGGKDIDITLFGEIPGEGVHWNVKITDVAVIV